MLPRKTIEQSLGKTFADKLDELIIDAGDLQYTRRQMVEKLGCPNFNAAARLNKVLKRFDITTVAKLHQTSPLDLADTRGVGMTSLFVAMCILDSAMYSVEKWWGWKATNVVKFSTYKAKKLARRKKRNAA